MAVVRQKRKSIPYALPLWDVIRRVTIEKNDRRYLVKCSERELERSTNPVKILGLFISLSLLGFSVYNIAGYNALFDYQTRLLVRFLFSISLLTIAISTVGRIASEYRCILMTFFGISLGFLLSSLFGNWYLALGYTTSTVEGLALAKFAEVVPILVAVLLVSRATGCTLNDIFMIGGKIPKSLLLGILVVPFALVQYLVMGGLSVNVGYQIIIGWMPWLLLFGFSNGIMEELIFRGIIFKKYEPLMGNKIALIQTSSIFAIFHTSLLPYMGFVTNLVFLVFLFFQGFAWGWVIQKSESIWGGVLAHMIADMLFVIVIFGMV